MNIELGSIIGRAGPALANFGEVMKAPIGNIINEGPARGGFLGGEILFQAKPSVVPNVIQQAESVAAAAWGKSILPVPGPTELSVPKIEPIVAEPAPAHLRAPNIVEFPKPQVIMSPALEPQAKIKAENKVSAAPAQSTAVLPQPAPAEQEVEEIVEEKVKKQKPEERLEEAEEIESQMYLEDENASAQRRIEIREAIVKARPEADRLGLKRIAGWLVAKFLPGEHEGNRSQVVRKTGPDGSYQETVEEIAGTGELESEEQAVSRFDKVVADKKPVKYGKNGNPVGNIDIARVFKYWLIKPKQASEEAVKRVVKKKEIKAEPNLEEISPVLAEVFQKAA